MVEQEQYIDGEAMHFGKESNYEQVILKQMQVCIDNLSKELRGGVIHERVTKTGNTEKYIEDVRELIVNSIDTFRTLMKPFIKEKYQEEINLITQEVLKFKDELNQMKINIRGKGLVDVKTIKWMTPEHPVYKEFIQFKAEKCRELFEILIMVYHRNKSDIKAFSEE